MTTTSRVRGLIIVYGLLAGLLACCCVASAQDLDEDFTEAVRLFQERSYRPAISRLEQVTTTDPENEAAWYYLGVVRYRVGELEDALEALRRVNEIRPGRPGTSYHIGLIYEELGAYDEAIRALQTELRNRQFKNLAEVFTALGRVYYWAGRFHDAIDTLTEALEHNDKYVEALYYRGLTHYQRKSYEKALEDFEEAVELVTDWDRLRRQLDRLIEREGQGTLPPEVRRRKQQIQEDLAQDYARAQEFAQDLTMRPSLYLAYGDAADANGDYARARNIYRMALDPDKGGNEADPLPHTRIGQAYFHQATDTFYNDGLLFKAIATADEAIRTVQEALKISAEFAPAHKTIGDTFYFQADTYISDPERNIVSHSFEDAIGAYDAAIEADPEYMEAYLGRAQAHLALEQADQALADLRTALEMAPRKAGIYAAMAEAHMLNEDYSQAINAAQTALNLDPESAQAHNAAGLAHYFLGELGIASEHFSQAIEADPTAHQSYTNLGNAFFQMGSWHRARAQYEEALERIPTPAVANTAIQRSYLYYLIARTYHHSGLYEREVEALNKALGLDAAYLEALTQLASAYAELGKYKAARQALQTALSVSPGPEEDAAIHVQMGRLYEIEGRPYEAITSYGAALAAHSDNIEAREALKRLSSG
ncbi:MAG: tetratricopeptide repeat protein [Armatimonadota bacterium]